MRIKTILTVILAAVLLTVAVVPATAATQASFSVTTVQYAEQSKTYTAKSTFLPGESCTVVVSLKDIPAVYVRGMRLSVSYDTALLSYDSTSWSAIADSGAEFTAWDNGKKVLILWETTSNQTIVDGDIFFIRFKIKDTVTATATSVFRLEVSELYRSANGMPSIDFTVAVPSATITVTEQTVPEDVLSAISKLETVTLESLNDITAATVAYNALSTDIQKLLSEKYPDEYSWLTTAMNRYNRLVEQANQDNINAIIADFNKNYGELLKKTANQVTLEDEAAINALDTAYSALTSAVKTRMDKNIPAKIEELKEGIDNLYSALQEVKDYDDSYSLLYDMNTVASENFVAQVDAAYMVYGTLSDTAKEMLADKYAAIKKLKEYNDEKAANDAEESAIREKVNQWQQKWLSLMTLNARNVKVADETAIKLAIADYEKIEDAVVKQRLESKIKAFNNLLSVIEELKKETGSDAAGDTIIQEIIKEGETKIIENTNTVVDEQIKYKYLNKGLNKTILILFVLLAVSVMSLALPLIRQLRYNQALKEMKGEDIADED